MLQSLHIAGFRKYKDFALDGFGKINFILGENNIGKTTILEAIYAWACGQYIVPFLSLPLSRGRYGNIQTPYWVMEELLTMFTDRHSLPLTMVLDGVYNGKSERFEHTIQPSDLLTDYDSSFKSTQGDFAPRANDSTRDGATMVSDVQRILPFAPSVVANWSIAHEGITVQETITAPFTNTQSVKAFKPAKFIDLLSYTVIRENVQMYASLKREGVLQKAADEMHQAFPEIVGFDTIPYPDGTAAPVSVVNQGGSMLPLYAYGDGVQKWFHVIGALTLYRNSLVCIDEIDTGFHPSAQASFCMHMARTALKNNVQLFLSTHNMEFIDKFLKAVVADNSLIADSTRLITLRNTNDGIKVRNMSATEANNARDTYNMELR